jgi:hypothetical protein
MIQSQIWHVCEAISDVLRILSAFLRISVFLPVVRPDSTADISLEDVVTSLKRPWKRIYLYLAALADMQADTQPAISADSGLQAILVCEDEIHAASL